MDTTRNGGKGGALLRAAREKREWGVRKMGEHLGVNLAAISRIENGLLSPSRILANRMEALLGIPTAAWDDPADLLPQDGSATGEAA